jgi:hypothetical protein
MSVKFAEVCAFGDKISYRVGNLHLDGSSALRNDVLLIARVVITARTFVID